MTASHDSLVTVVSSTLDKEPKTEEAIPKVTITKNASNQTDIQIADKPKESEDSQLLLSEYQATIERFKQDNEELHRRLQASENDTERYRLKVNELSAEKTAWERVEK